MSHFSSFWLLVLNWLHQNSVAHERKLKDDGYWHALCILWNFVAMKLMQTIMKLNSSENYHTYSKQYN